ncbi:hypothetical protein [Desulfosporosinus fructosivorans]
MDPLVGELSLVGALSFTVTLFMTRPPLIQIINVNTIILQPEEKATAVINKLKTINQLYNRRSVRSSVQAASYN